MTNHRFKLALSSALMMGTLQAVLVVARAEEPFSNLEQTTGLASPQKATAYRLLAQTQDQRRATDVLRSVPAVQPAQPSGPRLDPVPSAPRAPSPRSGGATQCPGCRVPQYHIVALGTLGGNNSYAMGINNRGSVVGWAQTSASNGQRNAFVYNNAYSVGRMAFKAGMVSVANNGTAFAINDAGAVAGESNGAAFIKDAAPSPRFFELFNFAGWSPPVTYRSWVNSINDRGVAVGAVRPDPYSSGVPGPYLFFHAARIENGQVADIGNRFQRPMGANNPQSTQLYSQAMAINGNGVVVGWHARIAADYPNPDFKWWDVVDPYGRHYLNWAYAVWGGLTPAEPFPWEQPRLIAWYTVPWTYPPPGNTVQNSAQVCRWTVYPKWCDTHRPLWRDPANSQGSAAAGWLNVAGNITYLGSLGGAATIPSAINSLNDIVGYGTTSPSPTLNSQIPLVWSVFPSDGGPSVHAFFSHNLGMKDLGALGGGHFTFAFGMNKHGDVVGVDRDTNDHDVAFIYSKNQMTDLNWLVDQSEMPCLTRFSCSGGVIVDARGINDSGSIAATVCNSNANTKPPVGDANSAGPPAAPTGRTCQAVRLDPIPRCPNGLTNWPSCSPF